jgi:hypothetical protein
MLGPLCSKVNEHSEGKSWRLIQLPHHCFHQALLSYRHRAITLCERLLGNYTFLTSVIWIWPHCYRGREDKNAAGFLTNQVKQILQLFNKNCFRKGSKCGRTR